MRGAVERVLSTCERVQIERDIPARGIALRESIDHLYIALPPDQHLQMIDLIEATSREWRTAPLIGIAHRITYVVAPIVSSPCVGSSARMRTAAPAPSGSQTRFAHQWMPYER